MERKTRFDKKLREGNSMEPLQVGGCLEEREVLHLSCWLHDWGALVLPIYLKLLLEE